MVSINELVKNYRSILRYGAMFVVGALVGLVVYTLAYGLYRGAIYSSEFGQRLIVIGSTVGWALWPLLAIGVYLTWLSSRNIKCRLKGIQFSDRYVLHLEVIAWLGMMVGLLGTVSGLIKAMQGTDISLGMQETISRLNASLGEALLTTFIGVIISIIAQLQVSLQPEESEGND